jgi:hypothetical protein
MAYDFTTYRPWFIRKLVAYLPTQDLVEDGEDGLSAGTIQEALQDLATRVQALEDAANGGG